jgi:molecular chaperone GrpE
LQALLQGIELVRRELLGVLAKHGVRRIDAEGKLFDPAAHEAMTQIVDESVPAGTVIQVLEEGYQLRDRMLRPARVVVSRRSEAAAARPTAEPDPSEDE